MIAKQTSGPKSCRKTPARDRKDHKPSAAGNGRRNKEYYKNPNYPLHGCCLSEPGS